MVRLFHSGDNFSTRRGKYSCSFPLRFLEVWEICGDECSRLTICLTNIIFLFSAARRLEAMARSPIYALLSEVMDGLPTIRSLVAGSLFQVDLAFRCQSIVSRIAHAFSTFVTERIFQAFGRFWKAVFHFFLRRAAFGSSTSKKKEHEPKRNSEKRGKGHVLRKVQDRAGRIGNDRIDFKDIPQDFLCWLMVTATAFSSLGAATGASGVSTWSVSGWWITANVVLILIYILSPDFFQAYWSIPHVRVAACIGLSVGNTPELRSGKSDCFRGTHC